MTTPVSAAYNFTLSGAGNYSIKPSNLFTYVDVGGSPRDLNATVGDIAEIRLSGNLIVPRVLDRRAIKLNHCSQSQKSDLVAAIREAFRLLVNAIQFLDHMNQANPPPRWTTWFGPFMPCKKDFIRSVFVSMISDAGFQKFNYDCSCNDAASTSFLSAHIFQLWDYCYSVTDRSLDQLTQDGI